MPPAILCAHIASGCGLLSLSEDEELLDDEDELEELDDEDEELLDDEDELEDEELLDPELLPANGFL